MIENGQAGSPASPRRGRAAKSFGLLPCLALVLQGCARSPTDDWLAGGWTTVQESCDSGGGYVFRRTGQWGTEGEEGTWKLDGNDLTINVTGAYDEANELQPSNDVYRYHITEFDENGFATSASGKIPALKWKRCAFDTAQAESTPTEPESPAYPQVTAMLEANDPKVCAMEDVHHVVLSSIAGNYDSYLAEGGKPVKLKVVNATGVKPEIHEVSCSASITGSRFNFGVRYVIRPGLSSDSEFVVSNITVPNGGEFILASVIEDSRRELKGPTPAAQPSQQDAAAIASAAAKESEAAAAEAAAAASEAIKY